MPQIFRIGAFHYTEQELSRQAEHRAERHQGLRKETRRQQIRRMDHRQFQPGKQPWAMPPRVHRQRHKRSQFDERFQGDRQHQAVMVFARIDAARAKQDREQCKQQRAPQGAVATQRSRHTHPDAAEHAVGHRDGLQLQCEVRHYGDDRDDCHQRGQTV